MNIVSLYGMDNGMVKVPLHKDVYPLWKEDPLNTVVLNTERLSLMLHGRLTSRIDEKTKLAMTAIKEAFLKEGKDIIYQGKEIWETKLHLMITGTRKPILTIISGIPGAGKTTYAMQQVATREKTIMISNDDLRGMLAGVPEQDIQDKILHTNILLASWETISIENFIKPEINIAKNALIKVFLEYGYDVVVDGVHSQWSMWNILNKRYKKIADVSHVLIGPANLYTGLQKAKDRLCRPESWTTIKELGKEINRELLSVRDATGMPKYLFNKVIANYYEHGGFQEITHKFYEREGIPA